MSDSYCGYCRFGQLLVNVARKADGYDRDGLPSLASPYRKMAATLEMMIAREKDCSCVKDDSEVE